MGVNVKIPLLVLMGNYSASFISWAQVTCITQQSAPGEIHADLDRAHHSLTVHYWKIRGQIILKQACPCDDVSSSPKRGAGPL